MPIAGAIAGAGAGASVDGGVGLGAGVEVGAGAGAGDATGNRNGTVAGVGAVAGAGVRVGGIGLGDQAYNSPSTGSLANPDVVARPAPHHGSRRPRTLPSTSRSLPPETKAV